MRELTKIKKSLENDEILEQIKNNKLYLLSEYDKKLLFIYLNDKRLVKFKKEFIYNFINRIKSMDINIQTKYFKELESVCKIHDKDIPIQIGMVLDINYNMPTDTTKLQDKPVGFSKDAYFNEVIEKEDYDELFNLYGLEEIETNSNLFDKVEK